MPPERPHYNDQRWSQLVGLCSALLHPTELSWLTCLSALRFLGVKSSKHASFTGLSSALTGPFVSVSERGWLVEPYGPKAHRTFPGNLDDKPWKLAHA